MTRTPVTYFKALADETRLRLLNILNRHELNVNEIVDIMQMGQSRISRHLKILADSGLLSSRRSGLWIFYSTAKDGQGRNFLDAVQYLFVDHPSFGQDIERTDTILDNRTRNSTRFFDSVATDWTRMRKEIIGDFDLSSEIVKRLPKKGKTADLGCGSGDLLGMIAQTGNQIIGVDGSRKMLEEARKLFQREGTDIDLRIDLRVGDLEHLPLRDREVDTVILNMVLHHLHSPLICIKETQRVLKRNGRLIIAELLTHSNEDLRRKYHDRWLGFQKEEIESWLGKMDFTICDLQIYDLQKGLQTCLYTATKR